MDLKILVLKDKRPGHFRQSEGVVKAISRRRGVHVSEIEVRGLAVPGSVQRLLAAAPARAALRLWRIRLDDVAPPDLIVSAGADTLVPNALTAGHFGARNIFVGSARGLPGKLFTAVLRAVPDTDPSSSHIRVLKPSSVDPDELARPRPFGPAADMATRNVALLVGGPTHGMSFDRDDWEGLGQLVSMSAAAGLAWRITSSPRTPAAIADWLDRLASSLGERVRFTDFRVGRTGSIGPLLEADAILVTEDSNSMIAEAVAACRPVVVLRPSRPAAVDPALGPLLQEGSVSVYPMCGAHLSGLTEAIGRTKPLAANPLDRLYEQMAAAGAIPP